MGPGQIREPHAWPRCAPTPLGLWLVRMVHIAGRADPAPLLAHADATALRAELLDQLIPAVIRTRQ